jgi:hypothetical protein
LLVPAGFVTCAEIVHLFDRFWGGQ